MLLLLAAVVAHRKRRQVVADVDISACRGEAWDVIALPGGMPGAERLRDNEAVVDGNVITSQGPGTSLQFALKIVEELYGEAKAQELAEQMVTTRA
eukprot:Skav207319  [mRNA]  locus=scaffold3027:39010:41418:- [translate_table: standard]